jgi:DNA-binding IclR family transcriptional regulator
MRIEMAKQSSALDKGFAVLLALRQASEPLTLTAIAERTGVAASSVHSTLHQLAANGAVLLDREKRYHLGPALYYLGASFARGTPLYRSVWVELIAAANEAGVTAALAVPWDDQHLILAAHRGPGSDVAVPFGGVVPIDAASWGKVYYASSDVEPPDALKAYTPNSITDREKFAVELESARARGYAVDDEEYYEGVQGVCAAITSAHGYEGLASFLAARSRFETVGLTTMGQHLANLAARASFALGDKSRMRLFGGE